MRCGWAGAVCAAILLGGCACQERDRGPQLEREQLVEQLAKAESEAAAARAEANELRRQVQELKRQLERATTRPSTE
ncbi:MAG TPA: hypothetical protein VHP11_09425 [Tepidisphaeraceae bacterium]|nr:hypothetical protein [Tepidisphaeraceae bacterium]